MRKLVSFAFFFFLQFFFSTNTFAYDFQIGNLCYTITSIDEKTVSVEAAEEKPTGDVVIPSIVNYNGVDFSVTSIPDKGFAQCYNITSLTLPHTMKYIGSYGLGWMLELRTLIFDNPQRIVSENTSFYDWREKFTTVKIINCDVISLLKLDFSIVNYLPNHELYINDIKVEEFVVPDGTEVMNRLFANCKTLKSLTLPNTVKDIYNWVARNCTALKTITLSSSLENIGDGAFAECPELRNIYIKAATPPKTVIPPRASEWTFSNGTFMFATLYVPKGTLSDYKNAETWNKFANIEEIEYADAPVESKKKCSTPIISYNKGKISFTCDTEGVEYISEISNTDIGTYTSAEINVSATYNISVYAKAKGYDNSEAVSATLCWIDVDPKTEGISNGVAEVRTRAVLIKRNGGQLTVEGIDDGQTVELYSLNGEKRGSAVGKNGAARINTNVHPGSVVVVKMGEKSVKVIVK